MNPTHESDNNAAQSRAFGENFLVDLLTDKDRFSAWIASANGTAAQPVTSPILGLPMTDADRRRYALRDAGYAGWVDQDGYARTDAEFSAWSAFMSKVQSGWFPAEGGGYVLTEAGRQALANADTASQFTVANALAQGVTPDQLVTDESDGEPCFEWLSDQDADEADSHGERLAERCLAQAEAVDSAEVGYVLTGKGHAAIAAGSVPITPMMIASPDQGCEVCGQVLPFVRTWQEPLCVKCAPVVPAGNKPHVSTMATPVVDAIPGSPARVLPAAARYLETNGWIQGAYYDSTSGSFSPPACMVGAIGMICYGGPVDAPAQMFDDPGFLDFEQALLHLDRYLLVEDGRVSYEFNDAHGRRLEDITQALRGAGARSADELIDALRVIDAHNADTAALAELLLPSGAFARTAGVEQPVPHADYPHTPGTLYDCSACEAECFCTDNGGICVHCALEDEKNELQCGRQDGDA